MKSFILSLIVVLFVSTLSAQVYVGDSFIYSKGTDLYVKGNINLSNDGEIYLRGESQLIQADDVVNEGAGFLSVFQEGTATNFDYNFWSAPVSQATATGTGNEGFVNTQIFFPRLQAGFVIDGFQSGTVPEADLRTNFVIDAQQATILPTGIRDGETDEQTSATVTQPLRIAGRWLYSFRNGGGYTGWAPFFSPTTVIESGYGFSMKGVSGAGPNMETGGQRYDFRGRPNNGTITVNVETDDFSLVGNPYPSALDLKQFLIDNNYNPSPSTNGDFLEDSVIDNEILFWEQNSTSHQLTDYEGGYGTYVPGAVAAGDLTNGQYTGTDNGMFTPAVYTRFDSAGNITITVGGGGAPAPVGQSDTRRYAPIGQGFTIGRSSSSNGNLGTDFSVSPDGDADFRNSQRTFNKEDGTLSYFKAAPGGSNTNPINATPAYVRPKLRLNIKINDLYVRQLLLAFGDDSTDNLDWGLEGRIDNNKQPTDAYMPQFGGEYIIKTIPFLETKRVDLGVAVASNNSTLEFHVGGFENFDTPHVYIHDKYNNTYHEIKNNSYTTVLNAGTIDDRFELVFQDPSTLSNDTINIEEEFDIVQNNSRQLLTIFNPSGLEVSHISLFDLAGKEVVSSLENSSNDSYSFETGNLSSGIYIVRVLTTSQQEVAVKVSISN